MNPPQIEYLFPTFLIRFKFDKHDQYKNLFDHVKPEDVEEQHPQAWTAKLNTDYGSDKKLINEQNHIALESDLRRCIMSNLPPIPHANLQVTNFWYNIYKKDYYQEAHHHCDIGNVFSGIYFHKNSTPPSFTNPCFELIGAMGYHSVLNDTWFSRTRKAHHKPDIEDGDVIVFPSDLVHEVPRYTEDNLRITFSFNITVIPPNGTQ